MGDGHGIYGFVMLASFALLVGLAIYITGGAVVISSSTPPSPTPATAACTIVDSNVTSSGGTTAEFALRITRCGALREIHLRGSGYLDTNASISFAADTIAADDLPFIAPEPYQFYSSRICAMSFETFGNDLQVYAWIMPDGSLEVVSSIVHDDSEALAPDLGAVWTDVVSGFPLAYASNVTVYLLCDMSWTSATAAAAASGLTSAASRRIRPSAASMATNKARLAARTYPVPPPRRRTPRPPTAPLPAAARAPTPTKRRG